MSTQPKLTAAHEQVSETEQSIAKPVAGNPLEKFKSKRSPAMAGVTTLLTALPIHKISEANDFVRLHPDEAAYWSDELCFVNVPVKGQKRDTLHLIDEELAMRFLPSACIQRHRLALAAKPHNVFFLCIVPTRNTDNVWVSSNLAGCEQAKTLWTRVTSRRDEGAEGYKPEPAMNEKAFPPPDWPTQPLPELILATFTGRMIDREDHPGLLRLIGEVQSIS